jgi:hypothetical protein
MISGDRTTGRVGACSSLERNAHAEVQSSRYADFLVWRTQAS